MVRLLQRMTIPGNFSKGRTASLTATCLSCSSLVKPMSASVCPLMSRLA